MSRWKRGRVLAGAAAPAQSDVPAGGHDRRPRDRRHAACQECKKIFRIDKSDTDHTGKQLLLHTHQREAILKAKEGKSYVLTSGTGSGKSLTYIVPIVDHVLRNGSGRGIQAIVVYPMNALANSQDEELGEVPREGLSGRKVARSLRPLHGTGEGS